MIVDADVSTLKILLILSLDQGSGFCVTGKVEAGYVQTGDRILALPPNETCTVKGTHRHVSAPSFSLETASLLLIPFFFNKLWMKI